MERLKSSLKGTANTILFIAKSLGLLSYIIPSLGGSLAPSISVTNVQHVLGGGIARVVGEIKGKLPHKPNGLHDAKDDHNGNRNHDCLGE